MVKILAVLMLLAGCGEEEDDGLSAPGGSSPREEPAKPVCGQCVVVTCTDLICRPSQPYQPCRETIETSDGLRCVTREGIVRRCNVPADCPWERI